jgi:hypothetical protein
MAMPEQLPTAQASSVILSPRRPTGGGCNVTLLNSISEISPRRLSYLKARLVTLGIYALNHTHSHAWVPAITCLIQRRCAHA